MPLMQKTMTPPERLVQQFWVARVLIHEVCHAIKAYAMNKHQESGATVGTEGINLPETFYENEEMSEWEWSNGQAIWGGQVKRMINGWNSIIGKARPVMALQCSPFPNWINHLHFSKPKNASSYKRFRHGNRFGSGAIAILWPIPISWLEEVQSLDYWTVVVPKFGAWALRTPQTMGTQLTRGDQGIDKQKDNIYDSDKVALGKVAGSVFNEWIKPVGDTGMRAEDMPGALPQNATAMQRWLEQHKNRNRSIAIKLATRQHGELKRKWAESGRSPKPDVEVAEKKQKLTE